MAATSVDRRTARRRPLLGPLLAVALTIPIVVGALVFADAAGAFLTASYACLGLVLAVRRPGQPIAWLLLLMALGLALGSTRATASVDELTGGGNLSTTQRFTSWANGTGWTFVFAGMLGILHVFPRGTLPHGRWRAVAIATIVAYVPIALLLLVGPTINVTLPAERPGGVDVPNPFTLPFLASGAMAVVSPPVLFVTLFGIQVLALAGLLARFRRSEGLERLQHRWLAWAVVIVVVANAVWAVLTTVLGGPFLPLAALVVAVSYPAIPVAVVVAVLRYRLYEIDRLVSRTLGWGLATALVVAVFAVVVLALQAGLSGITQGQTLAVAVSTLLAFAVFQPVRRRVQALVDRRFDRPRIEAERTLEHHGEQLAHEVELNVIERRVVATVADTVRPTSAAIWIRPLGGSSRGAAGGLRSAPSTRTWLVPGE